MKIMPTLALAACSIGLFSAIPVAHAQGSWQIASSAIYPTTSQQTNGSGTGSVSSTTTAGGNILVSYTFAAEADASGNGQPQSATSHQQISAPIAYQWVGMGPPTAYFYIYMTPTATASFTDSNGTIVRGGAGSSAGASGTHVTAGASQSYRDSAPSSSGGQSYRIQFQPTANPSSTNFTATATADASGTITGVFPFTPCSFTATAKASIQVSEPSTN